MISDFLVILANIVSVVLTIYYWLIIIRALLSWVNPDPYNPVVNFLYRVTEPVLGRLRSVIPLGASSGIDLSPLIAVFVIYFFKSLIVKALLMLAFKLSA